MTILDAVIFIGLLLNTDKEKRPVVFIGLLLIAGTFALLHRLV